ncbi:MAG: hypothetical protein PHW63_03210 [Alphaproteobacteria bacterium]|nr:hypothetical protein [Alphaproteobacteria bacterium]
MSLQICRECKNTISSEAVACPSCGCPVRENLAKDIGNKTKQKSRMFGWLGLIAFLMSNFIPAILAPLVILAGLVFAVFAINQGSKIFGGIVFLLCIVQVWGIANHFSGLNGTLGITNPKEIEETTAQKYSTADLTLPANTMQIIEQKCEREWPNDFSMRAYCQKQQKEGVATLNNGQPATVSRNAFTIIRAKCATEWPQDFNMRAYCEKKQYEAYDALQTSASDTPKKGACAEKWPNDYHMRQYCESK